MPKAAAHQGRQRAVPSKAAIVPKGQPLKPRNCILPDSVVLIVREEKPGAEVQYVATWYSICEANTVLFRAKPLGPLLPKIGIRFLIEVELKPRGRSVTSRRRTWTF